MVAHFPYICANGHCSNEDKSGWVWTFAKKLHPCLNTPETTIITNWEKGSIEAIAEVLPLAVNFFCSFHRKKNIETFLKGGKGKYLCHWFYQQLLNCSLQETLTKICFEHSAHMNDKVLWYINLVADHQQFPAVKCVMGDNTCMYQQSSQWTAESMNNANLSVRERTAVDPVNTTIILLQLESKHYNEYKAKAWKWDEVLTPHGKKLSEDVFKDIDYHEYEIHINAQGYQWLCCVQRLASTIQYQCYFKAVEEEGLAFRGCSCGRPKMHGIPCVHMVAVVRFCCIEGLNPVNAIPPWWMTAHWRKQYPQGADLNCDFDIQMLKHASQDTTWRYCPPYTALMKAGRQKKKKLKLAIEVASEHYGKKKKKVARNSKELDGNMKSTHDEVIGENVITAGMEDKETAVKKKKRGKVKGRVASSVKTRVVKVVQRLRVMIVKWERMVMTDND